MAHIWTGGYNPNTRSWTDSSGSYTWTDELIKANEVYKSLKPVGGSEFLKSKRGGRPVKYLYRVYVVSVREEILMDGKLVVVENDDEANFLADVSECLKKNKVKPKDVTVLYECLGIVKVEEEPQKVKIVKEAEGE